MCFPGFFYPESVFYDRGITEAILICDSLTVSAAKNKWQVQPKAGNCFGYWGKNGDNLPLT